MQRKVSGTIEMVFDIIYLLVGTVLGVILLVQAHEPWQYMYGIMALVLVFGDSFHLIPRINAIYYIDKERFASKMGTGKMITSVTMTFFYLFLWQIGLIVFDLDNYKFQTVIVYILALCRVILCLCPQNRWAYGDSDKKWNIYRNIPFLLLGLAVTILFGINSVQNESFKYMWLAIVLSYGFYIPVVLWSEKYPAIGSLMLPKSCVYIWIIIMGLSF